MLSALSAQPAERNLMDHLILPEHYESGLDLHETQIAIKTVKSA